MESKTRPAARAGRFSFALLGLVLGALTSLPVIAIAYLGNKWISLPFFPFDLFDWLARVLPGNVITLGIDSMVRVIQTLGIGPIGETAKTFEQSMGVLLVMAGGAVLGLLIALGTQRAHWSGASIGTTLGILVFLFMAGVELSLTSAAGSGAMLGILWLAVLIVGWGALLGRWVGVPVSEPAEAAEPLQGYDASRRAMLIRLAGGSIGVAIVAAGLGRLIAVQREATGAGQVLSNAPAPSTAEPTVNPPSAAPTLGSAPAAGPTAAATMRDRVMAAPGTRSELTSNEDFYRIDIDTLPVVIDKASWKLDVTGLFDHARTLTLSDLMAYPAVTQTITQACISNPVGGDLIGTINYTGPRLRDVMQDLGLQAKAQALAIQGADGFYESVSMQDIMDPRTLLVYGMNGTTLPAEHGFPLRIYIPNRYGMKQPKWITAIQAIDHTGPGYWVERGWSPTAFPQIASVVDTVARDNIVDGRVPVGGIAWAGDRGIQKVEVQVDNGPWAEAVLRTPPLSPLTWMQWRYDWPVVRGTHTFRVRATDGTGALQTAAVADTYPDGATGYHSISATL